MKKLLMFGLLLLALSCSSNNGSDKPIVWKLGHIFAEDNIMHSVALKFAEEVNRLTEGRLVIQVYPNSLEGSEIDNINGIRLGTSQMTITGESLQTWAPKAAVMAVPYTFRNVEHVQKGIESEIGDEIAQEIEDKVGLVPLLYVLRLPRNLTSNRPIRKPSDLNNLIVRIPNVPLFVKAWETLGAKPTPMALNEVFTSLQQGTIQGQENPIDLIYTSGFYEVQKYINLTEHVYSWLYIVVGKKQLDSLSQELKEKVFEASKIAQDYGIEEFNKIQTEYVQLLKDKGVTFIDVDKTEFENIVKPAMESSLTEEQRVIYNKILAID